MHILYVHKNYPAQFGHIAHYLIRNEGFRCTFVSARKPPPPGPIEYIQYIPRGGATNKTHFCSRTVENFTWHSHAVYEALRAQPGLKPDLIVGHSGFGSTLFLADLYDCPIINFCEWFYDTNINGKEFRSEFPRYRLNPLRARMRNAMLLADLACCTAGYSPTHWQRSRLPAEYQYKVETIFDGIDTQFWHPRSIPPNATRQVGERRIPAGTRIVTYVSRGFETVRGFDVFMQIAKEICRRRRDVVFVCVGSDRASYSDDPRHTKGRSFRQYVLDQGGFDLDRFIFTGRVSRKRLAALLGMSDLHIYLTVPFVLSWSLMNALSCGATVLASDTEPVREVIRHGRNGLLAPFYDVPAFVERALAVLDDPVAYRGLGRVGRETIRQQYSLEVTMPKMLELYQRTVSGIPRGAAIADHTADSAPAVSDTGQDGWERLAAEHPWPVQRPEIADGEDHDWLGPVQQQMLAGTLGEDTRLVVETGAWTGLGTRAIAHYAPRARVIAVDAWKASPGQDSTADWKASLPEVYRQFAAHCWDVRDRVVALPASPAAGLQRIHACGAAPDVIYMSAEHANPLESDLRLARRLFPNAVLMGNNWTWPRLQRAIEALAAEDSLRLEVMGNTWKIGRTE